MENQEIFARGCPVNLEIDNLLRTYKLDLKLKRQLIIYKKKLLEVHVDLQDNVKFMFTFMLIPMFMFISLSMSMSCAALSIPPSSTLGLRHYLRPMAPEAVMAPSGGRSFYCCSPLAVDLFGRGIYTLCIFSWNLRGRTKAMATNPLCPLARLFYAPGGGCPIIPSSLVAGFAVWQHCVCHHCPQHQQRASSWPKVPTMGVATPLTRLAPFFRV
jgi:hypothetical protein